MSKSGRCGFEGEPPCEIEEVTIKVPTKATHTLSPGTPYGFDPSYPMPPSGGCGTYNNCGGGGGSPPPPPPPPPANPCEKSKKMLQSPAVETKINELKEQSKILETDPNYGEKGVNVKADGTTSGTIHGGKHHVNLGSTTGYQGGYHNHTPEGTNMHSPPDILSLLSYAISQPNGNFGNAFFGMVGSEPCSTCTGGYKYYHYIISFSGTKEDLDKYLYNTNWDKEDLVKTFRDAKYELSKDSNYTDNLYGKLNSNGLQKLFFDTLKNMGMEGKVNLQRIDENGTIQNITQDTNGSNTTATPCPQ